MGKFSLPTTPARSALMRRILSKNTGPEKKVRSMLHQLGFRFRIHVKELPGKPDIVLPKYQTVIFVHGCFWHQHMGCNYAHTPKTNQEYWRAKFTRNISRFIEQTETLSSLGWKVNVVWECQTKNPEILKNLLVNFLVVSTVDELPDRD